MSQFDYRITEEEVKVHRDLLASLDSHDDFLSVLGVKKTVQDIRSSSSCECVWTIEEMPENEEYYDAWCRSRIGEQLDRIKKKYGFDMIRARRKVLAGEAIYVAEKIFEEIRTFISAYPPEHSYFITSGIQPSFYVSNPGIIRLSPVKEMEA